MTTLWETAGEFYEVGREVILQRLAETGHKGLRMRTSVPVLRMINESPGATVGQLAPHLDVTQQMVSKMVQELQEQGYVEVEPDTTDARRRPLHTTARGVLALGAVEQVLQELENALPLVEDREIAMERYVESQRTAAAR